MINLILTISENEKYITAEENPLSAQINHFLNAGYYSNLGILGTVTLFIVFIAIILITRTKK